MSPIIDLQRRMVEAGRIRAGDRAESGAPRKLSEWRLTSKDEQRLVAASVLWGGEVKPWDSQFELYTTTDALPIMLLPGHLPTTWFELWSKGGNQRRCDGQYLAASDERCQCDPDERECKPHTRLSVLLPDLPGIGSWLVTSTGWNAAAELAGSADLLQRASAQGVLLPARLRLEQRTEIKAGQTRRFAVPVLDVDVSFRELLAGQQGIASPSVRALPAGFTPIAPTQTNGPTLAEGLAQAETQTTTRTSRSAVEIPADDVFAEQDAGEPSGVTTAASNPPEATPAADAPQSSASPAKPLKPTKRQLDKLNVLVGTLRDGGHITTEQLWSAAASSRGMVVDNLIDVWEGKDAEGVLHWSPLRGSLTREEASSLIDRLERYEQNVGAA